MLHQIYIADEAEMRRCQRASAKRISILIGGEDTRDGSFRVHRGLVKNVEDVPGLEPGSAPRWRVTMQA
jgi:hypothetical protein